jgi:3-methyl-2-oxobutanoate hydroxymethyltransferase
MSKPANGSGGERGDAKKRKVTTLRLQEMKEQGERIACLTAYDFVMARLLDEAGIDVLLVGDSAGMVFGGQDTTISVTMPQMLYHATVVARAVKRALVVGDLPFMSYQASVEEALRNAGSFMKEALVEAVKLEGGEGICPTVRRIVDAGIPVMGHLGLTPQSIHKFGSYRTRARTMTRRSRSCATRGRPGRRRLRDRPREDPGRARARRHEGAQDPDHRHRRGSECDGQILVVHDMLGLFSRLAALRAPLRRARARDGTPSAATAPT